MDLGLTMGWDIVSIGDGVAQSAVAAGGRCCGNVSFSRLLQTTCVAMETAQASLDTSVMLTNHDNIGGAMFVPVNSIDILRSHSAEAAKQLNNLDEASLKGINWFQMSSQIWR